VEVSWIRAVQKLSERAFAALITYERRSFSSPELFLQLFSAM